ncbi:hypothetical protein [Maritalea sp.]|uniref:hypothetical protein n=1 Tax=Maritalea sp. TaxID=2003361 RepID=UPI003F4A925C
MRSLLLMVCGTLYAFGPPWSQLSILLVFPISSGVGLIHSAALAFCFYAIALLPAGLAAFDFSQSLQWSFVCWLIPATINSIVIAIGLSASPKWRPWTTISSVVALSIPPFSTVSIATPIALAGILFPGAGNFGIAAMLLLIGVFSLLGYEITRTSRIQFAGVAFLSLLCNSYAIAKPPSLENDGVIGISTYRGMPSDMQHEAFRMVMRHEELERSEALLERTIVWPESIYGEWQQSDGEILSHTSKSIIGGSRAWVSDISYVNVLVSGTSGETVYAQASPLPLSFGRKSRAVSATQLPERVEQPIAALICFEIANTWLVINRFSSADHVVVWAANLGWSKSPSLNKRLTQQAHLWSALYRKNVAIAVNYSEVSK